MRVVDVLKTEHFLDNSMLRCRIYGRCVVVTIAYICLICNQPTQKQTDLVVEVLSLMTQCTKQNKRSFTDEQTRQMRI